MSRFQSAIRLISTFVVWSFIVYSGLAIIGAFLLPIGLVTLIFITGGMIIGAIVGTIIFNSRSGSLRQLKRFAIAVYVLTGVVGLLIQTLGHMIDMYGSPLAVIMTLLVIGPSYAGGYYLVYENGYQRLKSQYIGSDTRG